MDWPHILNAFLSNCSKSGLLNQFKELTNNYQRVELILKNEKSIGLDQYFSNQPNDRSEKCQKQSDDARSKGNSYFSLKTKNQNAFTCYTRAIVYAPTSANYSLKDNKLLVLGYSNRSAVFYDENLFHECLADINVCMEYFNHQLPLKEDTDWLFNLVLKLANRQKNCYHKLKCLESLKNFLSCKLFQVLELDTFSADKYKDKRVELVSELDEQLVNLLGNQIEANSSMDTKKDAEIGYLAQNCFNIVFTKEKGKYLGNPES
jgi:hypothetical protein